MIHVFIGMMVLYQLTDDEAEATNIRRDDARETREEIGESHAGFQAHCGRPVLGGEARPMVVTEVWPTKYFPLAKGVNGQVFLDGSDSLWVTNVGEGGQPGQWKPIKD